MQIKYLETNKILPYINNPRKNLNADKVASSIKEFGFQQPIVVDKEMIIIVGHTRHQAAKLLGLEKVPVLVADLPPIKAKAYRIADNRLNEDSEWDMGLLNIEFTDLLDNNFDMENLGFDDKELERLIVGDEKGLTDDDDVPELPKEPNAKLGDIYQLGEHRLMCGDSSIEENKNKLFQGNNFDMIFTDPPYGVDYVSRVDEKRRKNWGGIKNDQLKGSELQNFLSKSIDWFDNTYIFCNWQSYPDFFYAFGKPKQVIIWNKKWVGLGKGYRNQYEMCLFYGTLNITTETNLWDIKRDSKYQHPTQKPVALSVRAIKNSLLKNRICYDPFLGSGSTLIGCEKTKTKCFGMELDPKYVDVIIKRWEDYTGKKAELING